MKLLLILWPIIAFFGLLPIAFLQYTVLYTFALGLLGVGRQFLEYAELLLIPAGHLLIFLLYGLIVLKRYQKVTAKSLKLFLAVICSGLLALGVQLYARAFSNGISSIDCGDSCANTLYAFPGLTAATLATNVLLVVAFLFIATKAYLIYKKVK